MKKVFTLLLVLLVSTGFSQNNPIDFEPGGYGADWTWAVFENASNPPLEIIANPDPSGINTSATVAKFTALEAGNPWAGTESAHGDTDLGPFVLDETNSQIKIMVWKPVISNVGIKLVSSNGWAQVEILVPNTKVNEWEELTFDFSSYLNPPAEEGMLDQIVVFPDFDTDGREQDNIIYFDNITFNPEATEPGTDATLSNLMVDGTTVSGFSPSVLNYSVVLPEGTTDVPVVTATTNDPDANAVITPATAIPGTTSILVTSANTEVEKTYTVAFSIGTVPTEPEVAAPAPPAREPENVISVFSDAYTNVEGTEFNPNWGQSTLVSIVEIQGNETLKYENFNFQGTQFDGSLDVSDMEYLHVDMWTADATSVNVFTISPGPVETGIALAITPGQWVSYDIPLSDFTNVDMTDLIQFKFDGGDGSPTIYLDNLYFYKDPTSITNVEKNVVNIFPNPVSQGGDVRLGAEVAMVEIYDLTGKLVASSRSTSVFATGDMRQGIYMIRILDYEGAVQVRKLVVK
ncbi:MAG: T9SS C-terminal target domain-containing protein [Bacteroidetes bacterium]|nr:MAG: T9SS C-terminal target domain-containing protein [Bacteroidota bacterium]